jgi:hypothetical protein
MVVTSHTSGFGVFAAIAFVPILVAIIALLRGKPIVATLAGGSFLALVVGSMFWGYTSHRVFRTPSGAVNSEWNSHSTTWSGGNSSAEVVWSPAVPGSPLTAVGSNFRAVRFSFAGLIVLPLLLILGIVLFARAVSRKKPAQERGDQSEAWQEPRRGGWGEWGRGTFVLGVVLVIGILGAKSIFSVSTAQQQAIRQHDEMVRAESLARHGLRGSAQNRMQSAQHPALQDTRPLETVIEEFERPRIQLEKAVSDGHAESPA